MIANAPQPLPKLTKAIIARVARSLPDGSALAMARGLIAIAQTKESPLSLDEWYAQKSEVRR